MQSECICNIVEEEEFTGKRPLRRHRHRWEENIVNAAIELTGVYYIKLKIFQLVFHNNMQSECICNILSVDIEISSHSDVAFSGHSSISIKYVYIKLQVHRS